MTGPMIRPDELTASDGPRMIMGRLAVSFLLLAVLTVSAVLLLRSDEAGYRDDIGPGIAALASTIGFTSLALGRSDSPSTRALRNLAAEIDQQPAPTDDEVHASALSSELLRWILTTETVRGQGDFRQSEQQEWAHQRKPATLHLSSLGDQNSGPAAQQLEDMIKLADLLFGINE